MTQKITHTWDEETGRATASIMLSDGTVLVGEAQCHEDDKDFQSRYTGRDLAEARLTIKVIQHLKNVILTNELRSLKQLYYSMNRSKRFNPNSYEARCLQNQIRLREEDIDNCKAMIDQTRRYIKKLVDSKDIFYKTVRTHRANQH